MFQNAKEKASYKRQQGYDAIRGSCYDQAIRYLSEGLLLLPKLDMYAKERKQFYWMLAECHLNKVPVLISFSNPNINCPSSCYGLSLNGK